MAKIENHKYSIDEAFRECFYIIPDYQREYVWSDREVQQLLDDIDEQLDESTNREYFIGTVLVSPSTEKNHYHVIDGQQRLTTLFLLLCALKRSFRGEKQYETLNGLIRTSYLGADGEGRTSLKLEPRYENASELVAKLATLDEDPEAVRRTIQAAGINTFGSLDNLLNAYGTIHRHLEHNYSDKALLKKYLGYLGTNVVFIQISTDISSALKIFETINERGVGLNSMDLLKNLLFAHVKTEEFTKLKDEWKKITKPLESEHEKPLRFLRYFLMANYAIENPRRDAVVREDEIYDWLTDKKNARLCDYTNKPFEFVRKIIRNVELYLAFAHGLGNDQKPSLAMDSLKRLAGGGFSLHYVLLLAAGNFPRHLFDHFVRQLESFLFFYIFTKSPTKDLERDFSVWADDLRAIGEMKRSGDQVRALNAFIWERFRKGMVEKGPELEDALRRLTLYSMQQYRIRYLLAKLTQFVDMAYKGLKVPGSLSEFTSLEIEHILPNSPEASLRADFVRKNPGLDYDEYKNKLGNLALLEKPINIVASNDFFEKKRREYKKSKYYLTSSIVELTTVGKNSSINRINKRLKSFCAWDAAAIDARHELLLDLAGEVWKVERLET